MNRSFLLTLIIATIALTVRAEAQQQVSSNVLRNHDTRAAIHIDAAEAEVRQRDNIALFNDRVVAIQGALQLNTDALRVSYSLIDGAQRPDVKMVEALGNVRLTTEGESAQSDWGIYDIAAARLTLGGDVIFRQQDTVIRADQLTLDLTTGIWQFDSSGRPGQGVSGSFMIPERP